VPAPESTSVDDSQRESSAGVRARVQGAWERRWSRASREPASLDEEARRMLESTSPSERASAQRVARTIADLGSENEVSARHLCEALKLARARARAGDLR
jgi:predicted ATPase with chaperone activity